MSKKELSEAFQRAAEPPSLGVVEAAIEGVQSLAPGLSLSKIFSDVGAEMSHLGAQGSHEVAAALFTGSAFVMYPHEGKGELPEAEILPPDVSAGMDPEHDMGLEP